MTKRLIPAAMSDLMAGVLKGETFPEAQARVDERIKKHKHTHAVDDDGKTYCVYCGEEIEL